MVLAPGANVRVHVDRLAIGERLRVEVGDHARAAGVRTIVARRRSRNAMPAIASSGPAPCRAGRQQLLQRLLALADDDHVGAAAEVLAPA